MQSEKITGRTFWDFLAENLKLILTFITIMILLTIIALANNWINIGYKNGLVIGSAIHQKDSMEYTHRILTQNSIKGINLRTKAFSQQELMQQKEYDETIIDWLTNGHPIILLESSHRWHKIKTILSDGSIKEGYVSTKYRGESTIIEFTKNTNECIF